jgi:ankyrin repeat protein
MLEKADLNWRNEKVENRTKKNTLFFLVLTFIITFTFNHQQGNTLLLEAATIGDHRALLMCLQRGADVNTQNSTGNTATHLAALYGHSGCIAGLLANHPNLQIQNKTGLTAATCAFQSGFPDIARVLQSNGKAAPPRTLIITMHSLSRSPFPFREIWTVLLWNVARCFGKCEQKKKKKKLRD